MAVAPCNQEKRDEGRCTEGYFSQNPECIEEGLMYKLLGVTTS